MIIIFNNMIAVNALIKIKIIRNPRKEISALAAHITVFMFCSCRVKFLQTLLNSHLRKLSIFNYQFSIAKSVNFFPFFVKAAFAASWSISIKPKVSK